MKVTRSSAKCTKCGEQLLEFSSERQENELVCIHCRMEKDEKKNKVKRSEQRKK